MSNIVKQQNLLKKIQSVAMIDIKVESTKHVELRLSESHGGSYSGIGAKHE
jgi:hypothetical protein